MLDKIKILLVGCGSMGSALIKGWINTGVGGKKFTIVTPHENSVMPLRELGADIDWHDDPRSLSPDFNPDCIILAVKPQKMDAVLPDYVRFVAQKNLFITVAAGKNLDTFSQVLGPTAKLIRIMPNLPAAYNKGMSVGFAGEQIEDNELKLAEALFKSLGSYVWINDENLFGVVTSVSGAGPAYLYLLTDVLAQAGIESGLEPAIAETLARQTMVGAGILLENSTAPANNLKKNVASPGGVTEAALKVLEANDSGLPDLMKKAVKEAVKRAKELANA